MSPDSDPAGEPPPSTKAPLPASTSSQTGPDLPAKESSAPLPGQPRVVSAAAGAARQSPPISGWRFAFISLANRDFLLLWLGMLAMMSGLQMQMIARSYLVYDITASGKILGLVSAAGGVPMLVLALFGGVVADRVERKRLIQAGQGMSMVIALVVAVTITTGRISWVHLLIAAVVQGILWAFLVPARQAIIPELVGRDKLSNAIALQGAGMSATTLVAPAIAGVLYATMGAEGVYYVIAATGLVAVALTSFVRTPAGGNKRTGSHMITDIKAGLSYIIRSRLVMVLLAVGLATVMLAMPIRFLLPVFVANVYHRQSDAYGLLISVAGLGSLVGSLVVASLGRWNRGRLLILGGFASGVALLALAVFPIFPVAVAMMVLLGLGDAGRRSVNQALIMEQVEDKYLGRVMSVYMMTFGMMPMAILPAGLAIDLIGIQPTVGAMGVGMLAVSTLVLLTQSRLRSLQ